MRLITQHTVISVLVPDQNEALHFYTEQLGMEKRIDITYAPGMRLLTVAPHGQYKPEIALAHPEPFLHGEERVHKLMSDIGHTRPWIFVTDNCRAEYEQLLARGVTFLSEPTRQPYGLQVVFSDPYGNTFVLLEATPEARALLDQHTINSAA